MQCHHCQAEIADGARFCGTCGADQTDPGGGRTGATTTDLFSRLTHALEGRYDLGDLIGRGGMGAVFRATDLTLERPVAIKVLPPEMSGDESFVARFQREARTAAKLDHPGIIPIYAVESREDLHYFVMKFVAGRGLDEVIEGAVPVPLAQEILWQAATALGHAHQRGVIHRDIKPANIMIDESGRAVLTDFGISKAVQAASQLTATGQVIGTPHYMSPEQAKGLSVDGRSDQYSLGMVAYRMLSGRLPFLDDSIHTILYKQIFEDAPPLDDLNPDLPAFVVTAVHRALHKEAKDRFATMEEFATAVWPERPVAAPSGGVRAVSGGVTGPSITEAPTEITPNTPPPPGAKTRVTTERQKKRPVVGIAAGLVLLAAAGGGGWYVLQQQAPQSAAAGPAAPVPADSTPAMEVAAAGDTAEAAADTAAPPPREPVQTATRDPAPQTTTRPPPPQQQPPAERAPQRGTVTIAASPFGTVFIDGVEVGDTPIANRSLAPGRHVIRVVREGYLTVVDTIQVAAGGQVRRNYILTPEGP